MAVKFRHLVFRVLLTVCVISFTVVLFGKGWTILDGDDDGGPVDDGSVQSLMLQRSMSGKYQSAIFNDDKVQFRKPDVINLAVVVCGDRFNESVIMLKSAIIMTSSPLHFIILADGKLQPLLKEQLLHWKTFLQKNVTYTIMDIQFPVKSGEEVWRKLFKPCASQRLFLPTLLQDIDSLLYVDTDVIFLHPLESVWSFFYQMNSSQIAALTPEHEDYTTGWYNRFAKHPFYGPLGVNSGVMLMNLTRMREVKWQELVMPIYNKYRYKITWGDQDIINILFYLHPDKLYVMPCEWNYRPDHCMYLSVCKTAEQNGVYVLHGNRGVFHNSKEPSFVAIYEAFQKYDLTSNLRDGLLSPMMANLVTTIDTNCGRIYRSLVKQLQKFIYSQPNR